MRQLRSFSGPYYIRQNIGLMKEQANFCNLSTPFHDLERSNSDTNNHAFLPHPRHISIEKTITDSHSCKTDHLTISHEATDFTMSPLSDVDNNSDKGIQRTQRY